MPRPASLPISQPIFGEPTFSENSKTIDPTGFATKHASDTALYKEVQKLLTTEVVEFPPSRLADGKMYALADAYGAHGAQVVQKINGAGQILFHCLGDSGCSQDGKRYRDELNVADQLTADCQVDDPKSQPAFLYHLGDVVYDFGESQYYYDEFYEPFRNYPAPIFAIPGNHDSFIVPGTGDGDKPLDIFMRNFCAPQPTITAEARSLHRTAMTQPGVYFTLDAPFVRIIGLFSNALEDPGVISSEGTRWPAVPNIQLAYLQAQLQRIKDEKYAGAVLLAVHHPPFSYSNAPKKGKSSSGGHGSSLAMLGEIDSICAKVGFYPHAFLSGHAHNYQRFTRTVAGFGKEAYDVPFIICGDGGHHVNHIVQARRGADAAEPQNGADVGYLDKNPKVKAQGLLLEKYDDLNYGYLRITVTADQLRIGFHQVGASTLLQSRFDLVTVDLKSHQMVAN